MTDKKSVKSQTKAAKGTPSQEKSLVLKMVKIENNNRYGKDSHSNSCDNCNPWTSCCDSYS